MQRYRSGSSDQKSIVIDLDSKSSTMDHDAIIKIQSYWSRSSDPKIHSCWFQSLGSKSSFMDQDPMTQIQYYGSESSDPKIQSYWSGFSDPQSRLGMNYWIQNLELWIFNLRPKTQSYGSGSSETKSRVMDEVLWIKI